MKAKPFIYLSFAMYAAGLIGLNIEATKELFRFLTPFHLLSSAVLLILFEPVKSKQVYAFLILSYLLGFFIEVLGVNTGLIFGEYSYGETLGIKLWNTPLMIGVNWFVLSFTVAKVLSEVGKKYDVISNTFVFTIIGAAAMTFLDYLAEPPAIYHDMWSWTSELPPLQNYLGWFVVSWLLMYLFKHLKINAFNPLAFWVLLLQFLFFLIQNFTL